MTDVLSWHAQKYNDMIDQDGITLKRIFHPIWITMETSSTLETWKPWTKYFESYIFLQPPMTIDHLVIFVTFNTCVVIIYDYDIVTQLGMACQVSGDRLDSKPTFVLFHNDTRGNSVLV